MTVGDRLDLPAGTAHDAVVGADGVACLEAHRPAGSIAAVVSLAGRDVVIGHSRRLGVGYRLPGGNR